MASVLPVAPVVPSQPYSAPAPRRMPRRLTISIMNNPPNFSSLAPLASPSSSSSDEEGSMPPPGLGGRRLSVTRTSTPAKINPYAVGGALCEVAEIPEPTISTPVARPRLLSSTTSFFVQSPAPTPLRTSKKANPYSAGGPLSETAPAPCSKPAPVESKPMTKPLNLRVLTTRQIQDMAQAAQAAHNNQVQARMVAESILNRVRRRSQRRRFPRFGNVIGFGQPSHSPLRKLAFDESDISDDSGSSDGGSMGDWSSEDGSDSESLEEWERQLGDVSWFVDNGFD